MTLNEFKKIEISNSKIYQHRIWPFVNSMYSSNQIKSIYIIYYDMFSPPSSRRDENLLFIAKIGTSFHIRRWQRARLILLGVSVFTLERIICWEIWPNNCSVQFTFQQNKEHYIQKFCKWYLGTEKVYHDNLFFFCKAFSLAIYTISSIHKFIFKLDGLCTTYCLTGRYSL